MKNDLYKIGGLFLLFYFGIKVIASGKGNPLTLGPNIFGEGWNSGEFLQVPAGTNEPINYPLYGYSSLIEAQQAIKSGVISNTNALRLIAAKSGDIIAKIRNVYNYSSPTGLNYNIIEYVPASNKAIKMYLVQKIGANGTPDKLPYNIIKK